MEILVTANHCSARDVASTLVLACFCVPLNLKFFALVALATDALLVRKLSREGRIIERSRLKSQVDAPPSGEVFSSTYKTEECIDNFDFDMAGLYCQRALDIEPTNLTILDMLGNICAELGDVEKAKQISFTHTVLPQFNAVCVYLKAVELSPDEGHSKYMYLGQIHAGMEAVQYFSKGTEVMLNTMDKHTNEARQC
ncbi:unnamed protein product [Leuciscus chuanchicus]